jgi:inorganic pyrophosphatase
MSLDRVPAGRDLPNDCNVVIEIPMRADPIKYEVDKDTGAVFVDRFMSTAMHYPCNYGYIPHAVGRRRPVRRARAVAGSLSPASSRCRPIGMRRWRTRRGDEKILAVPIEKLSSLYRAIKRIATLEIQPRKSRTSSSTTRISSRRSGCGCRLGRPDEAKQEILDSATRYEKASRSRPS